MLRVTVVTPRIFLNYYMKFKNFDTIQLYLVHIKKKKNLKTNQINLEYQYNISTSFSSICNSLKLVERLRLPTASECSALGILPNDRYGSDHLALAATFQLKTRPTISLL